MRLTTSFAALLVLTACGGGGGGGSAFVAPTGPDLLLTRIGQAEDLLAALDARDGSFETASLPTSASYDGVMLITRSADDPGDTYYGSLNLVADFTGDGDVSGMADDFYFYNTAGANGTTGDPVGGNLLLNAPVIAYADPITGDPGQFDINVTSSTLEMGGLPRGVTGSDLQAAFGSEDDGGPQGSNAPIDMISGIGTITFEGTGTFDSLFLTCTDGVVSGTC